MRAWQTDDGLPDNCVTGVAQSADGYLWVGTRGGLVRFNGMNFTEMPLPDLPGVSSRLVRAMFLDHRGRMWLGMERGAVVCLDSGTVRTFGSVEGLSDAWLFEDQLGALWIGTAADGLFRL